MATEGREATYPGGTRRERLFLPWLVISTWCTVLMWAFPGGEVVPYHALWIGFALTYGFEPWPLRRTAVALSVFSLVTGAILVVRAQAGVVMWEETAEVPLMWLLALLIVWHVQRRQQALTTVTQMAARDVAAAEQRARLARLTSHEMRTPLTIATGYVDLLLAEEQDRDRRTDLEVVRDELGRLSRAGSRLLTMIRLQDLLERGQVDVDALLRETAQRWTAVARRAWVVEANGGSLEASAERLRACLDTLIENAVRHTDEGDTVRLFGFRHGGHLWIGVADSGSGLDRDLALRINRGASGAGQDSSGHAEPAPHSRTGLGIGIVQDIVHARGGRVLAGSSHEGGALVLVMLPLGPADVPAATPATQVAPRPRLAV